MWICHFLRISTIRSFAAKLLFWGWWWWGGGWRDAGWCRHQLFLCLSLPYNPPQHHLFLQSYRNMFKLVSIFIWHLQYVGPSYYAVFSNQEPLSICRRIVETQHRHWATGGALDLNDNQFGHLSLSLWLSTLEQSSLQSSFRFECFFLSSNDSDDTQSQWHANVDQKL